MPRKQKEPESGSRNTVIRIPLPSQKRQQGAAPTAAKRRKFSDERAVQQPLFDKEGAE